MPCSADAMGRSGQKPVRPFLHDLKVHYTQVIHSSVPHRVVCTKPAEPWLVCWLDGRQLLGSHWSVDTASADHEQLQQDEDGRDDEAEPELPCLFLLCELLAKEDLANQLQTEHGEDPQQPQHGQPSVAFLVQADGHDGGEVGAEAVSGKERHEDQPPAQAQGKHVNVQRHQHAKDQKRAKVHEELKGGKAQPLDQLPQREQHG